MKFGAIQLVQTPPTASLMSLWLVKANHRVMNTMMVEGVSLKGAPTTNGLPHRSPEWNGPRVGPKIANISMAGTTPDSVKREFFAKEPCDYTHTMFISAAESFGRLRHERIDPNDGSLSQPPPREEMGATDAMVGEDERERRLVYTLVFDTLKYQQFLEGVLEESGFFDQFPEHWNDSNLALVLLCELHRRRFKTMPKPVGDEVSSALVLAVEKALIATHTRISAAFARNRINARVASMDALLPAAVKRHESVGAAKHVCAWINRCKAKETVTLGMLSAEGFKQALTVDDLSEPHRTYARDRHCPDMLMFLDVHRAFLESHELITNSMLVFQDKSSALGPHSVKALLNPGDDVLLLNAAGGATAAHIASLTQGTKSNIYTFGALPSAEEKIAKLGAEARVKLISEKFLNISPTDDRLKYLKVALLTAECSRSAIANPISFIVNEGEDISILKTLSREQSNNHVAELVQKHSALLKHALRLPRMQAVIYTTRSMLQEENEHVVKYSLEHANTSASVGHNKASFRLSPPVLPLSPTDIDNDDDGGRFLRFPPSPLMAGCFLATITREADDPKEAAKDILSRAAAKGVLSGMPSVHDHHRKHRKKAKGKQRPSPPLPLKHEVGRAPVVAKVVESRPRVPLVPAHMTVIKHPQPFR